MEIRETTDNDLAAMQAVSRAAFDSGEAEEVARLVADILADPTARPILSLVAVEDGAVAGYVLFSAARVGDVACSILAPLAVAPDAQGRGVGGALVRRGLSDLAGAGIGLVFVAGWPDYYPRFGFAPAGPHGFVAPQPIPAEHGDGWMVLALKPALLKTRGGTVRCCVALDHPELWGP